MAQKQRCNHAYGLEKVRCPECGAHIASRCPDCSYEGVCDDHGVHCSLAGSAAGRETDSAARAATDT